MKIDFSFELTQRKLRKKAKKEKYNNIAGNNYKKLGKEMQFISEIYALSVYSHAESLTSLSCKVNYFDFAVFQVLLMRGN